MSGSILSHIMNVDGKWGTSKLRTPTATLGMTVSRVRFVAHNNVDNVGSEGPGHTLALTEQPTTTSAKTTVATIVSLIISKKRDNYVFAPVNKGCRFWLSTITTDLANAGIITSSDADRICTSLTKSGPTPPSAKYIASMSTPRPVSREALTWLCPSSL
ncbi:hypothetical protein BC628DRAFT_1419622 [Trametes gibbosa]|nr:hypothetical protein BC628DRAFT_1419622 [Trametes gibbosa]